MSRNLKHYQALDEIVTNALLALYLTMSQQGGSWTAKRSMLRDCTNNPKLTLQIK
ncbi:hypothetical protein A152_0022130 [Vibrio tasmaniensis 1F-187]|uniref:Uncharacterized protein n=1 Tax=Vibrio atlanticus TaxID=693153 RepID=A0ABV4KTG0_9VIBR|nr:hypothetical protein [Vibrio tasmaniensis]